MFVSRPTNSVCHVTNTVSRVNPCFSLDIKDWVEKQCYVEKQCLSNFTHWGLPYTGASEGDSVRSL